MTPVDPLRPTPAPPAGSAFMNGVRWTLFVGLLLLAGASLGRLWPASAPDAKPSAAGAHAAKAALYHCPMHPNYTSDEPGDCPICGMSLVPIHGDARAQMNEGGVPGLVPVEIAPERIQRIGVRTAVASRGGSAAGASLVGFVVPDERRVRRVSVRVSGFVRTLAVSVTGQRVHAGDALLTLYSPELYQSEQEYVIELAAAEALAPASAPASGAAPGASSSGVHGSLMAHEAPGQAAGRQRLRLLGVPDDEVRRLERERTPSSTITLRAESGGVVLSRDVTAGQAVSPDMVLLTLADLSHVWVEADVYEQDFTNVRVGDRVRFAADGLAGRTYAGTIAFLSPVLATETRTIKARIELDNADGALRPGMYGRITPEVRRKTSGALTVPSEAVVHTGDADYVFLAHAGGRFEPRAVSVGADDGSRAEVLRGIAEGDTVVASASFLIDSESRLQAAIAGLGAQPGAHTHAVPR